jgi:predicted dehydrogenase
MYSVNAAVAGSGFIGPVHVEALKRLGVNVLGVLEATPELGQRAAQQMGVPKVYESLEALLNDDNVQVIHIATPNRLHFKMASAVLKAGKHVLCEKPLAMNAKESAQLVDLARKTKLAAGVNYNIRFYPLCLEARDMVQRGAVGEVYSVCGSYVQDWLFYPTDYNWRVLAEQGGQLRAVADIGTHWLDLMHAITGLEIKEVFADLKTVHEVRQRPKGEVQTFKGKEEQVVATESIAITTDDYGCIMLRFNNGGRGVLWVSQVTAGRKNCLRYEIAGSQSALSWSSEVPNELWIGHRDRANESLIRDPALVSDLAAGYINYPGGHNEGFPDTFKQCFRAFYNYIQTGDFDAPAPFATFEDGHREVVLCEAILKSAQENRWIAL